jgi:hypothetical protein
MTAAGARAPRIIGNDAQKQGRRRRFHLALVDECVARTDQNGRLDCAGNRDRTASSVHIAKKKAANTVREIWSPV